MLLQPQPDDRDILLKALQAQLGAIHEAHAAEIARIHEDHALQTANLQAQIDVLKETNDSLLKRITQIENRREQRRNSFPHNVHRECLHIIVQNDGLTAKEISQRLTPTRHKYHISWELRKMYDNGFVTRTGPDNSPRYHATQPARDYDAANP